MTRTTISKLCRGTNALILIAALTASTAYAKLEISFGTRFEHRIIGTQDNTITQYRYPMNFIVRIRNIDSLLEKVWIGPQGAIAYVEFIFTNSDGKTYHVKKKPIKVRTSMYVSTNIAPDKEVWERIVLTDDEWDNLPPMAPGVTTVYNTQVIYTTRMQTIRSEMYKVYVGVGPLPAVPEEPTITTQEILRVVTPPGQTGVFIVPKPTEQAPVDPNEPHIIQ
jgi:hypothetical protein